MYCILTCTAMTRLVYLKKSVSWLIFSKKSLLYYSLVIYRSNERGNEYIRRQFGRND